MTLYVGNLPPDCTEALLHKNFAPFGDLLSIRLRRDRKTGQCSGFGFISYSSKTDAQTALTTLNYTLLKGKVIRLMWEENIKQLPSNANIFIKYLDPRIDEKALHNLFSAYGNIMSLKLAVDEKGTSRGYAYVQYEDEYSAEEAIADVNGKVLFGRVVVVKKFLPRDERVAAYRNIYIKNFDSGVDDSDLVEMCKGFGDILSAKVMKDANGKSKCFGFVAFKESHSAKSAVDELNGKAVNDRQLFAGRAMTKSERQKELLEKLKKGRLQNF